VSVKRPALSRRDLPARQRREIADRLRSFVTDTLQLSRRAFERRAGLPHATVAAWLAEGSKAPAVPDAAALIHLAETVQLNPAWLLLGDEPRVRGAPAPSRSLGRDLRASVVADFIGAMSREEAERLVPSGTALLRAFLVQMSGLREFRRGGPLGRTSAPLSLEEQRPEAAASGASETPPGEAAATSTTRVPAPPSAPEPKPSGTFEKVVL
jgi:hypothetical protein